MDRPNKTASIRTGEERFDRSGLAEVEQMQAPAVLEDGDQHAEGGAGGEQVHHCRDRGDEQAAERHHQQQEPEPEDDPDDHRHQYKATPCVVGTE